MPKQVHVHASKRKNGNASITVHDSAAMHLYAWVTILPFTKVAGSPVTSDEHDGGACTAGIQAMLALFLKNSFCCYSYFVRNIGVCNTEIASDNKPATSKCKTINLQVLHKACNMLTQVYDWDNPSPFINN
jgi:hypothetical protein